MGSGVRWGLGVVGAGIGGNVHGGGATELRAGGSGKGQGWSYGKGRADVGRGRGLQGGSPFF